MNDLLNKKNSSYFANIFLEWIFWIVGSVLAVFFVQWGIQQYGEYNYELHIWISITLYLWYVSTMSLIVGRTYFVARTALTQLERRQNHPQKPENIDLTKDISRLKRIKNRAVIVAAIVHVLSGLFVYIISRHIPGITSEFRIYAVVGVFAVAAIKPGFAAISSIRAEIFGMQREADYPVKSVAKLWQHVEQFGDYEERLKTIFEEIENSKEELDKHIEEKLTDVIHTIETSFKAELSEFKASDNIRQTAYNELKEAQIPVTKEISKVLASIQSLKDFVIELRDKNIKGEQLMSALKEFGIDSLADLNVSFQKNVVNRNSSLSL